MNDKWMDKRLNRWIKGQKYERMINEWMNEWMNERKYEWKDKWMKGWINQWMNEWIYLVPCLTTE